MRVINKANWFALLLVAAMFLSLFSFQGVVEGQGAPMPAANAKMAGVNKALDARLQEIVDNPERPISGLSVITMQDGKISYTGNFGYRYIDNDDPSNNLPVNKFTMFRIASVAKLITGIGVMQQVERGAIDLDRDVSDYLGFTLRNPDFPDAPITARMLLSHTSSIRDTGGWYSLPQDHIREFFEPDGGYWNDGKHWAKPSSTSDTSPGQYFTYSNLGYGVLGTIIEAVTGERYYDYMRTNILEPLNITGDWDVTAFTKREIRDLGTMYWKRDANRVWDPYGPWYPHRDDFRGVVPQHPIEAPEGSEGYVPGTNATWQSPMGGLRISALDLSKFMQMFVNNGWFRGRQILSATTVEAMFTPTWTYDAALNNGNPYYDLMASYGLGAHILTNTLGDRLLADVDVFMAGHLGGGSTMLSGMMFDRASGDGFVYIIAGLGAYSEENYGDYSSFYIWEEEIITSLFEEQLLK